MEEGKEDKRKKTMIDGAQHSAGTRRCVCWEREIFHRPDRRGPTSYYALALIDRYRRRRPLKPQRRRRFIAQTIRKDTAFWKCVNAREKIVRVMARFHREGKGSWQVPKIRKAATCTNQTLDR